MKIDFRALEDYCKNSLLPNEQNPKWFPASSMSLSEVMAIIVLFHVLGFRCFKWYYQRYILIDMQYYFPNLVSYNRFVRYPLLPMLIYTQRFRRGKPTGIGFID